mmetsp:Transcript_11923/g.49758  ORF Transcript_11923/g.49758 Transcript_11923/m.49758 type:complete len:91 (+) Transcript_11923:1-273(+)
MKGDKEQGGMTVADFLELFFPAEGWESQALLGFGFGLHGVGKRSGFFGVLLSKFAFLLLREDSRDMKRFTSSGASSGAQTFTVLSLPDVP